MSVWIVRGGKYGETESISLDNGIAQIGFNEFPDLANASDKDEVKAVLQRTDPELPDGRAENWAAQLNAFANRIQIGDIVVMPLKTSAQIALGKVTSRYHFVPDERDPNQGKHRLGVDWVAPEIPRSTFKQDLLYSFGAFLTVCQIKRHNAEARVQTVLADQGDPGDRELNTTAENDSGPDSDEIDLQGALEDQITRYIQSHFSGHGLARLVAAVLAVDGYKTKISPPGPDGGVDILGGKGPLGLDSPRLLVQVKATSKPAEVSVYRNLQGSMQTFQAEQGLLVSWSGFTRPTEKEAAPNHFNIRLWDQSDVLSAVFRTYDHLPESIKTELPLARTWALVSAEPG